MASFCKIPGISLDGWMPPSLLVSSVVLAYYGTFAYFRNNGKWYGAIGGGAGYVFILWSLIAYNCRNQYTDIAILLTPFIGIGMGVAWYYITTLFILPKESFTVEHFSKPPFPLDKGASKKVSDDPNVGTCKPPNDEDQFVCEMYKDGQLVTSTVST